MMSEVDLWDARVPNLVGSFSNVKYEHRLIWCALQTVDSERFYANEVRKNIKLHYGDSVPVFTVAWYLKTLESLGYVDRVPMKNDVSQFTYGLTAKFKNFCGINHKEAMI